MRENMNIVQLFLYTLPNIFTKENSQGIKLTHILYSRPAKNSTIHPEGRVTLIIKCTNIDTKILNKYQQTKSSNK